MVSKLKVKGMIILSYIGGADGNGFEVVKGNLQLIYWNKIGLNGKSGFKFDSALNKFYGTVSKNLFFGNSRLFSSTFFVLKGGKTLSLVKSIPELNVKGRDNFKFFRLLAILGSYKPGILLGIGAYAILLKLLKYPFNYS